jgi:hypothetical protein
MRCRAAGFASRKRDAARIAACQFIPSAGQVGTRAEVRENASPYFFFLIASDLCRSDCGPRMFAATRAVPFNLMSIEKM